VTEKFTPMRPCKPGKSPRSGKPNANDLLEIKWFSNIFTSGVQENQVSAILTVLDLVIFYAMDTVFIFEHLESGTKPAKFYCEIQKEQKRSEK
jgi:hypothetical protein